MRRRIRMAIGWVLVGALCTPIAGASTLVVDTPLDVEALDGKCSLREALVAANTDAAYLDCPAGSGWDVIELAVEGTFVPALALPTIDASLTLRGLGAERTVLDGEDTVRLLHFPDASAGNGDTLRVEGMTLMRGTATEGGAIHSGRYRHLEIADCVFLGNHSTHTGGAVHADIPESVSVERSLFVGNSSGQSGGGLHVFFGPAEIVESTFAGNTAGGGGGGVHVHTGGEVLVWQSTFSGNQADVDGGGLAMVATSGRVDYSTFTGNMADQDASDEGSGGGLSISGPNISVTVLGSILADNFDGSPTGTHCPDTYRKLGAGIVSEGFNLVGANSCATAAFPDGQPNVNADWVGTAGTPLSGGLAPLADNGGPTWTHLPAVGSLAIDRGSCSAVDLDQRGYGDPVSGVGRAFDDAGVPDAADGCDIGSTERGALDLVGLLFWDGFETGTTEVWASTVP